MEIRQVVVARKGYLTRRGNDSHLSALAIIWWLELSESHEVEVVADMIIARSRIEATIHYVPGASIVYLNNAKVACSSLKKAIWMKWRPDTYGRIKNPHDRQNAPFCRDIEDIARHYDEIAAAVTFTVVRNPYVRILSAYLDKIGRRPRDAAVWFPFARRFRLSGDAVPSFDEFLHMIVSEDPSLLDQHFSPQHLNILQPFATCDFVGHLEYMDEVWSFLNRYGVTQQEHRPHQTNANSLVAEYYGDSQANLVFEYFKEDFSLFGYSPDISVIEPVARVQQPSKSKTLLRTLIQSYVAPSRMGRLKCLDSVVRFVPDLEHEFNMLENYDLSISEVDKLAERAIQGEIQNWKVVARIAFELLRNDMILQAAQVTDQARRLMYG